MKLQSFTQSPHQSLWMRISLTVLVSVGILQGCAVGSRVGESVTERAQPAAFNAELAYLEKIVQTGERIDEGIFLLLMQEYQSSKRERRGIKFFSDVIEQRGSQMTTANQVLSHSALGILMGEIANEIPLLSRVSWVNRTISVLDKARAIGGDDIFFSRLATGLVFAQLPGIFGKSDQAREDLDWLMANADRSPLPGIMRQVESAADSLDDSDAATNQSDLEKLGKKGITSNYSVSAQNGATFYPERFQEIVPGQVYLLTGIEFTEYYFIISKDRQHLISIDAGTRPDFARAAYTRLSKEVPDLPPLTTVFFTHAHWDHVGGIPYFRELNPMVEFYGRDNYHEEIEIMQAGPHSPFSWFFGSSFDHQKTAHYHPNKPISKRERVEVGGTVFDLIPAPASETPDAMFIHMPEEKVLFVGDFIMPFTGAPFVEEGSADALLTAIDLIDTLNPEQLLHGHQPLTNAFPTPVESNAIRPHLDWLIKETRARIRSGVVRAEIHRENLMPASILSDAKSQQFFLVMRENVINRLYDQAIGYWETDLTGLDTLDAKSYGVLLTRYLSLDESGVAGVIEQMLEGGDFHLAERVARWARAQWPESDQIAQLHRQSGLHLRRKYQAYNPFKFIIYSELARSPVKRISLDKTVD